MKLHHHLLCCLLVGWLWPALPVTAAEASDEPTADRLLGPPFTSRLRASLGPVDATVFIVEVSDFACTHCREFHERVFPRIRERYVDTGLIRYVVIPAPTPGGGESPELFTAAKLALRQGRFWELRSTFFALAGERDLAVIARRTGLPLADLRAAQTSPAVQAELAADRAEAARLEVRGSPTFFFRVRTGDGFDEARVDGYESWDYVNRFLTDLLRPPAR